MKPQPAPEQLPEIIYIDGILHTLFSTPLAPWLRKLDSSFVFDLRTPQCKRGYIGRWKIEDDTLVLTGLYAWRNGEYTGVPQLFGDLEEVAADWYSGSLVVEPSSSAILEGAYPKMSTLVVEAGRIVKS